MKTLKIASLLIIVFSLNAMGQNGSIKGIVKNQNGEFVPFVNIKLQEINKILVSDESGAFALTNIKPNNYTIIASFVGYKTLKKSYTIEANKTLNLSFELVETGELLNEIVVVGYVNANEKPISVGKIAIKPMDLPQSVSFLDQKVLEQQQVLRMSDVLANTNGVYIMGASGGYQEEIAGRGFAFGSNNTFKNGIRYFNGMINELSGIEKVEIMKGSTAILFGNVAAGGILNLVTKKPKHDFGGEIGIRTGSFGLLKPTFDIYSGIGQGKKVAFRINGSYEQAKSFRAGVSSERQYINPSLIYNISKKASLLLEADVLHDTRTPDFGVGIINYEIVNIPREKYLGLKLNTFSANQKSATATFDYSLTENWKLKTIGGLRQFDTYLMANTRPNSGTLITTNGDWIRNVQKAEVADKYRIGQIDLNGNFSTGTMKHQALLGFDTDAFETTNVTYKQFAKYDTINVFGTKTFKSRNDIPNLQVDTRTTTNVSRFGVYGQDLLSLSAKIKVLAGLRYSYQHTKSNTYTVATNKTVTNNNYDEAFSPRLGLVIQPNKNHTLFASYANSFTTNTGVDVNGNALAPSIIDQTEIGVKNELLQGKISANLTIYNIRNSNLAQISLENGNTNTNIKELTGSIKSNGIEIDIVAKPFQQLLIIAGYSYNDTKYVKSNTFVEGSKLRYNPNHTANASFSYDFSKIKGLTFGVTGLYFGKRFAGRSTRIQVKNDNYRLTALPAFTQIDANLSYTFKHISVRTKLGNITNTLNYNVHDDNSVNPIAPRNYSATIIFKL